ncbi:FAD-dependent monooxygenase [Spirosoma validum]|uniref:FAD-dependent monooxygenase n=1 Tax=Spirosoma validum TaxID=2771355 RepID=A0A927B9D4_9BACT|nr:FAD-dependent monooxygenase [Spirosoma validum]MBD2757769.1 FAD-dependent monooxygenase [Spirosoma validum]
MTKQNARILIAGASIAGPTLAYWLHKHGFEVTIIEKAPALRLGGQSIDASGPARQIARWMGLEPAIRAVSSNEAGIQWVDKNNHIEAAFPRDHPLSITDEMEILRGDLVNILYELTRQQVTYRFNAQIERLDQDDQQVSVTFSDGQCEHYDLVIAADGIRSKTRKLIFEDESVFKYLGVCVAYLTIPRAPTDTNWARWYTADESRIILLRSDSKGTTRASVLFLYPQTDFEKLAPQDHKSLVLSKLADAGWEASRLSEAIEKGEEMYFDGIGQIKAPQWFKGRLGMIGDAAYCPSPITGRGVTLAMVGAYLLAGELSRHQRFEDAFSSYEGLMRPYVESVQGLPPGVPELLYPSSATGVAIVNKLAGLLSSRAVKTVINLLKPSADQADQQLNGLALPRYGF